MMDATRNIYHLVGVAKHRDEDRYYSIIHEYPFTLNQARKILADHTRHIQPLRRQRLDQVDPPPAPRAQSDRLVM